MTPERQRLLEQFATLSVHYPAMRPGQIVNLIAALARGPAVESIYDVEDDEFVRAAEKHLSKQNTRDDQAANLNARERLTTERRQVLDLFAEASELLPDMRIGQWMTFFASGARGPQVESIYDVEDEELIPVMSRFVAKRRSEATLKGGD